MMIKLYKQIDKIRIHAEKKCKKIMTQDVEFSQQVQLWYDRIHAYMVLFKVKERTKKIPNMASTMTRKKAIENPSGLTIGEITNDLRFYRIRAKELRKQTKGLRNIYLRNC